MSTRHRALVCALALASAPALAVTEMAGAKFEDMAQLGGSELALNGAGLRTKAFFKIYAIALYLPAKQNSAAGVLDAKGAARLRIVTLRDLTASQFADALMTSLQQNNSEAELARIRAAVVEFRGTLLSLNTAPEGTNIAIDYLPERGTQLTMNGQPIGKAIAGEAFHRALLKIWLGSKPVQDDLKDALLGRTN